MDKEKVQSLAKLSRIEISQDEAESLSKELGSILDYVGEIKSSDVLNDELGSRDFHLKNVFRDDVESHKPGEYTEAILSSAPNREGNYIKVKKIL